MRSEHYFYKIYVLCFQQQEILAIVNQKYFSDVMIIVKRKK